MAPRASIPHDNDAEQSLLASMLTYRDAIATALDAGVTYLDFHSPRHGAVYQAILDLHSASEPIDLTTVCAQLQSVGANVERAHVFELLEAPATAPGHYARIVRGHADERHLLKLTDALTDAITHGTPTDGILDQITRHRDARTLEQTHSWQPVDLLPIVTGQVAALTPELLTRADGQALLYPGLIHAFNAEPEAGKTWLALAACAQCIAAHQHAAYLDFEDSAAGVTERLLALCADPDDIIEYFHYFRIDDPIDHRARAALTHLHQSTPLTIAIIDGVAEAMAGSGWDESSNTDIAAFYLALPRQLARHGTTVVLIDHLVKDKDSQGRYARGAGHKLAGIDGATFKLEGIAPFGRGLDGMSKLTITKDRPGWLRHIGKTAAEIHVHSNQDGTEVTVELRASNIPAAGSDEPFRPTNLMERVSETMRMAGVDELSTAAVARLVPRARKQYVIQALEVLVAEGNVERRPGPRGASRHRLVTPYRESDDPQSSRYQPDDEPPEDEQEPLYDDTF